VKIVMMVSANLQKLITLVSRRPTQLLPCAPEGGGDTMPGRLFGRFDSLVPRRTRRSKHYRKGLKNKKVVNKKLTQGETEENRQRAKIMSAGNSLHHTLTDQRRVLANQKASMQMQPRARWIRRLAAGCNP
jgi:hypothetical protein